MILKILVGDTWEVFDGFDRISHREIPVNEPVAVRTDYYDFTEQQEKSADQSDNPKMELWLYKGLQVISQLIAHRPIYILNDEGKTIERV